MYSTIDRSLKYFKFKVREILFFKCFKKKGFHRIFQILVFEILPKPDFTSPEKKM